MSLEDEEQAPPPLDPLLELFVWSTPKEKRAAEAADGAPPAEEPRPRRCR